VAEISYLILLLVATRWRLSQSTIDAVAITNPLCTFVPCAFVVEALKCINHKGHEGTQRKCRSLSGETAGQEYVFVFGHLLPMNEQNNFVDWCFVWA